MLPGLFCFLTSAGFSLSRKVNQIRHWGQGMWLGMRHLRGALVLSFLMAGPFSLQASSLSPSVSGCAQEEREHVARERTNVMMILSPRMPYALKEWRRMKKTAEDAGFKVVAVRDPRVPAEEWQAAVQAADVPELMQVPAIDYDHAAAFDALNHAPASLVSRCTQTHPWPVLGVMPDGPWLEVLRAREVQLKQIVCC